MPGDYFPKCTDIKCCRITSGNNIPCPWDYFEQFMVSCSQVLQRGTKLSCETLNTEYTEVIIGPG